MTDRSELPADMQGAFEGDPPTGPPVPVIAMLDLVQALLDYRLQGQSGPPPTRIKMSLLARRAYLAELIRTRRFVKTEPDASPSPDMLPVALDEAAEGFSIRFE